MRHLLLLLALSCALSSDLHHATWFAMADCVKYIVQAGDICYNIAQASGMSVDELESRNPGLNCLNLQIGQVLCVSSPGSEYNGNVFMEYLGAHHNGVTFSDVPINSNVDFYFILASAIDYSTTLAPTNGIFQVWWQDAVLTPEAVKAIKAEYDNVKVMLSIGGDTVSGQSMFFTPNDATTWVANAVSSLTSLITEYDLDGIDIKYEHFATGVTEEVFAECIGQLIGELKNNSVISVATIAPYDGVEVYYVELFEEYGSAIDYVNFQFYTSYPTSTSASQYASLFGTAAAKYGGGSKVLASFSTARGIGPRPATVLRACEQLKGSGKLPGVFVWSADSSIINSPSFTYEGLGQALVATSSSSSS